MTDEMWALQRSQMGPQTVLNTAVPATIRLTDMKIDDQDVPTLHEYGPQGELFSTVEALGIEYATHKISGGPGYNELLWLLTNILGVSATTTPAGGVLSRQHVWCPPVDDIWTPKPYTLERGSTSGRARQYMDFITKTFQFTHSMEKWEQSGDAFSNEVVTDHALTSALSGLPQIPILGEQTNVYLDTTNAAGLGTTQLLRYFTNVWGFADVYAPEFPGTRASNGFTTFAQLKPKATGTLTVEADSVGEDTVIGLMRAGSYAWMRVSALGPIIEGSIHYQLTADMAIKFTTPSDYKNVSDFAGLDWGYTIVKDPAWTDINASGQAIKITLVNKVAAVV